MAITMEIPNMEEVEEIKIEDTEFSEIDGRGDIEGDEELCKS